MKYLQTNRGFTLIELLVVIAIIGMLSSVVLASLNSARKKARDARRVSDVKELQTALAFYYDDQSVPAYPTALSVLVTKYIPKEPKDPKTGNSYGYVKLTDSFKLGTTMELNKLHGTVTIGTAGTVSCNATRGYCVQP